MKFLHPKNEYWYFLNPNVTKNQLIKFIYFKKGIFNNKLPFNLRGAL
jgi:hypothetical protein